MPGHAVSGFFQLLQSQPFFAIFGVVALGQAAQDETRSTVPGIGYPVPLAIATVVLSVVGYFFAIFG